MNAPETFVARSVIRAVVREEIKKHIDLLAEAVGISIGNLMQEAEARFLKQFSYKGVWQESMRYERGNFCSMGGVWHCNRTTTARPGTDDSWTLAVKSGRDGRDGKNAAPPERPRNEH